MLPPSSSTKTQELQQRVLLMLTPAVRMPMPNIGSTKSLALLLRCSQLFLADGDEWMLECLFVLRVEGLKPKVF
jgi:hypothetical protein